MGIVSRLLLNHPALGAAGGAALHAQIESIYQKLGDNLNTRFMTKTTVNDATSIEFEHNFKTVFDDLRIDLYLVDAQDDLTQITKSSTPSIDDFTIEASPTLGQELTHVRVTNNSGAARDIAMAIQMDPISLRELEDVNAASPEDGQALVFDLATQQWIPGSSGDSSFKLQSITANVATFKAGAINLTDGRQLNLAADLDVNLKTEVNSGGVTAPAASTRYYLYLDLNQLPSQTTVGAADRLVYEVPKGASGMFYVSAADPESMDKTRFVHLVVLKTDGASDYTAFENLAVREHQTGSGGATRTFDETYTSAPPATIAHNLGSMPTGVVILHNELANGQYAPLPVSNYLKVDDTNIYTTGLGGLTIDATHQLRIIAQVSAIPLGGVDNQSLVPDAKEVSGAGTEVNGDHVLADTSGGAFTRNLPANPAVGHRVVYYDATDSFDTNALTVGRNGQLIEGQAFDLPIGVKGARAEFVFVGGAKGWKVFD